MLTFTWKDLTKVHKSVRIPSFLLRSLIKRITLNKRRNFKCDVCWPFRFFLYSKIKGNKFFAIYFK